VNDYYPYGYGYPGQYSYPHHSRPGFAPAYTKFEIRSKDGLVVDTFGPFMNTQDARNAALGAAKRRAGDYVNGLLVFKVEYNDTEQHAYLIHTEPRPKSQADIVAEAKEKRLKNGKYYYGSALDNLFEKNLDDVI
jgi:hypothetical protein